MRIAPFLILTASFLLSGCHPQPPIQNQTTTPSQPQITQTPIQSDSPYQFYGSDFQGNFVWGGAMNLAWTDLKDSIIKQPIQLNTNDPNLTQTVNMFNNPLFAKNDLNEASYYIKSGFGQSTVDQINSECRQKFPDKSFNDLNLKLQPADIIAYAYFLKQVEYQFSFTPMDDFLFQQQPVKGFQVTTNDQLTNIGIFDYTNDDQFIISLQLKDDQDQLFIIKGYNDFTPNQISQNIHQLTQTIYPSPAESRDNFQMPNLHLDHHREYQEFINQCLANPGFQDYCIAKMFENLKFDMDFQGARVENEAVVFLPATGNNAQLPPPKNFILDQPFWIVMKRTSSSTPYFILHIQNTNIMEL